MTPLDNFYLQQEEPLKSCLLALRDIILKQDKDVAAAWKYGMPFFCYRGKMFCYLWVHKQHGQPYMGIVEGHRFNHLDLLQEKRSRMKIMLFDAAKDLPVKKIAALLQQCLDLYRTGTIKIKT